MQNNQNTLTVNEREVAVLRYAKGFSAKEIAAARGKTLPTIQAQLRAVSAKCAVGKNPRLIEQALCDMGVIVLARYV